MSRDLVSLHLSVPAQADMELAFTELGFDISPEGIVQVGDVQIVAESAAAGPLGLTSWTFLGPRDEKLRLDVRTAPPTFLVTTRPEPVPGSHPNGVSGIDHVVLMVPALETAIAGLEEHVDAKLRRRGEIRGFAAAFMRAGGTVLEIIGMTSLDAPHIWGIAFAVDDIEKCVACIREKGGEVGHIQPALQGGQIASSPPTAAFGTNIAFHQKEGG